MKHNNIIVEKSFQFSLRILKLVPYLRDRKIEHVLLNQILKSGTSIGANVEEAIGGSSKNDFIYKLEIANREARETRYWLRLFKDGDLLEDKLAISFIQDCDELLRILSSIIKSTKYPKATE